MATLFERIIGVDENKIPIHGIECAVGHISRGNATAAEVIAAYSLDAGQQADLVTFLTKLSNFPDVGASSRNKAYISMVVFQWLAEAEMGTLKPEHFRNEVNFWAMIDAEIAKI